MEFSGKNLHTFLLGWSVCVCVCVCMCAYVYEWVSEFDENKCSEGHNLLKNANLNIFLFSIFFLRVGQFWLEACKQKIAEHFGGP